MRHTIVVSGGHAAARHRIKAAREGRHGMQALTVEQVAQRLAGGFLQPVDGDTLARLSMVAIADAMPEMLGDLLPIATLPGLPASLAATLDRSWRDGIDLTAEVAARPGEGRLTTLAGLEAAVVALLPKGMLRPGDLMRQALARRHHATAVLGPVELDRLLDVDPVWRPLLSALGLLRWSGAAPDWWPEAGTQEGSAAVPRAVTCATARHEVIEAMRWVRSLLAQGVDAADIALAAASPGEFDDLVLAMSFEASLPIHFAHGRQALSTQPGQAAAALADVLLRGLSQDRVRRLATLAHEDGTPFGALPPGWERALPRAAPLSSIERWRQALASAPAELAAVLLPAITLIGRGPDAAEEVGETFLRGTARLLWRRALLRAPAAALEGSLSALRLPEETEVATAVGWLPAATLACCPRRHVWLLGLNTRTWPREAAEDPLLPEHLRSASTARALITELDRRAFHAIARSTAGTLVCSASRRDGTGRLIGLSPLMPGTPERLRRARVPEHAMSMQDRLMARPAEFAATPRAASAIACWRDWNDEAITPHDGLVRPDHPVLRRALGRVHSASSLKMLLRNPLGFTWRYALGWREVENGEEALELSAAAFGTLVHAILDAALPAIASAGGIGRTPDNVVRAAVEEARATVAAQWEAKQAVPPALLWGATVNRAAAVAAAALCWRLPAFPPGPSFGEVPFGDAQADPAGLPWDPARVVTIPSTDIRIGGRIDRLDLSDDKRRARLVDYKTGWMGKPGELHGGSELQRCLYAFAAQALLGQDVMVEAMLLYPREGGECRPLADPAATLQTLTEALDRAWCSLGLGRALPGPDTGGEYDALALALPAKLDKTARHKAEAARTMLGDAAAIWEKA